jgi:Zn-dependent peptidase ImmA (M78 family)
MAKVYRVPLTALYLSEPPAESRRVADYRTLPEDRAPDDEALVNALVQDAEARQGLIRSLREDADEARPLVFIGSSSMSDGVATIVESIRDQLGGIRAPELWEKPDADAVFTTLREAAERAGVIVILKGDLGSHHTAIEVDAFRGLSLPDRIAPLVVINDNDARSAWPFTLIHELAHLWLGQSAVSDQSPARKEERFCNDVASRFLLPLKALEKLDVDLSKPETLYQSIRSFAEARNLSTSMVAYRLLRAKRIAQDQWQDIRARSKQAWEKSRAERKGRRVGRKGGPDYYIVRRHRLGNNLIAFVARMLDEGAITTSKAARILGVKPANVRLLIERTDASSRAGAA